MRTVLIVTSFVFFLSSYAQNNSISISNFFELDTNKNGVLEQTEVNDLVVDVFIHADNDNTNSLTEKEYKGYLLFKNRIKQERKHLPSAIKVIKDIAYVKNGHEKQKLDLYLPEKTSLEPFPLVVWIHGGGWQKGSKSLFGRQGELLKHGFAVASVNYRFTNSAPFPAQVHDCKAAVRYLRKNAEKYNLDPDRFGAWGASAGGHLVSLLGTSSGVKELEGNIGVTGVSSKVQAVCDWYGPSDMIKMGEKDDAIAKRKGAENTPIAKLLAGALKKRKKEAKVASPVTYVSPADAPFLIMHGDKDKIVPLEQSILFHKLLTASGVESEIKVVKDAPHEFFEDKAQIKQVISFFKRKLKYYNNTQKAQLEDFDLIQQNIIRYHPSHWEQYAHVESETYNKQALILANDNTPVDVIIRRTEEMIKERNLSLQQSKLNKLKKENNALLNIEGQKSLFLQIASLRRKVMFSNPLLNFNSLVFLKHDPMVRGFVHMVDQYFGINQRRNGGVYRLDNAFSDEPRLTDLLQNSVVLNGAMKGKQLDFDSGAFLSLDLDYDADKILFAFSEVKIDGWEDRANWKNQPWTPDDAWNHKRSHQFPHYIWKPESSFHIFEANADGTNIKQLTDGTWDDFDPCYLPNGRIAFISARCGGNQRCGFRYLPTYNLHVMMPDGSDVQQLSFHDTNEWFPSVNNDGMIIYTRWDYVDRDANIAHHLWTCYPDGRDPRSRHGNYPLIQQERPWFEGHMRAIPNSYKYIGVAAPHHGDTYGPLILIDQSIPDDRAMSQVKRITPLSAFPEAEITAGEVAPATNKYKMGNEMYHKDWNYATPWALSDDLYLCVYDPFGALGENRAKTRSSNNYGIYLVDAYGNRELVYRDPNISCVDPIPFRKRLKPTEIPVRTTQMKVDRKPDTDLSTATIAVMNAYESEFPIPDSVTIKEIRIINLFPKDNHNRFEPKIGVALESLARGVLGTVPVEEDGSAYFECPTGAGIYFQILDENGVMIQNMRSDTYLHPGERLTCIGCHENKWDAPKNRKSPMAFKRSPSKLKQEMTGTYPITFPRLVQPVLDKHCVSCHQEQVPDLSLRGDKFTKEGWSQAMKTLEPYAWGKHGSMFGRILNGRSYSIPMQEGANQSKLYKLLKQGHGNVKLSPEEMRRITLWLDCNSNFFGAYKETERQAKGEIILPGVGLPKWTKDIDKLIR